MFVCGTADDACAIAPARWGDTAAVVMLNGVVPDEDDDDVQRPPTWGMLVARCPPPLARSRTPSHGSGNHLPGRARSRRPGGGHGRGGGAAVAVKKSATWPYRARLAGLRAANVVSCVMRTGSAEPR